MAKKYDSERIHVVTGDITDFDVDAIVNAANSSLMGGGGVDGAIHRRGGPEILKACKEIKEKHFPGGLPPGEAVITGGGRLRARYVIHTVGPVWSGGNTGEPEVLTDAYRNSLNVAADNRLKSVAFPAISTGVYGYPKDLAGAIAYSTVSAFLSEVEIPNEVYFVFFTRGDAAAFQKAISGLPGAKGSVAVSLNWREIDAVLDELPLAGSQVQKIRQPDFSSLVLELYRPDGRYLLYICLAQNATRIHRLTRRVENTVALQRFAQLLRSRIKSARILEASQIESDRIIKIDLVRVGVECILWIRLWSNAANIILTEPDGTIIDAFYRRPRRGEVSGGTFPPQNQERQGSSGIVRQKPKKEYSVRDFPGTGNLSSRIEEYYFSDKRDTEVALLKQRLEKQLNGAEAKLRYSVERAQERIAGEDEIIRCKQTGDLLMSNLHTIAPGQRLVTLENYYEEGEQITIELDPALSPEKNAQRYYEKSRKKKRRLTLAQDEVKNLERELTETIRRLEMVETDDNPESLKRLLKGTENRGGGKDKETSRVPGLTFFSGPFTIYVGRTSRENDDLLRRYVRGNDYWLHSRDTPGAYVFIKSIKGKSVPLDTLLDAGTLALHYSKAKSSGRADLFYTQVKYLRRVKDGKQGLVIPTQEKNLSVTLEEKRLTRLQNPTG